MGRKKTKRQFGVCVKNKGYRASLELRKIYEIIPDAAAQAYGLIGVIDESGEDYLFPATYFVPLPLPKPLVKALVLAT